MRTWIKHKKVNEAIGWARKYVGSVPLRFRTQSDLRVDGDKCDGYLTKRGDIYYIYLNRDSKPAVLIDVVIHELAHLYNWERGDGGDNHFDDHGEKWGIEYSRVYQDYWAWRDSLKHEKKA